MAVVQRETVGLDFANGEDIKRSTPPTKEQKKDLRGFAQDLSPRVYGEEEDENH